MDEIYDEMFSRNYTHIVENGFTPDPKLLDPSDTRRCIAIILVGNLDFSTDWYPLRDDIENTFLPEEWIQPTFHHTWMTLTGWGEKDKITYSHYYDLWTLMQTFVPYTLVYNRLLPTTTGIALGGDFEGSVEMNFFRETLRSRGLVKEERYKMNIFHGTLLRCVKLIPSTSERMAKITEMIKRYTTKRTYITMKVTEWKIMEASWSLRPGTFRVKTFDDIVAVIFDLDGVLVSSRDLHYRALNIALAKVHAKYVISLEDHLTKFDGLSTREKLSLLTKERGLPEEYHDVIWKNKQTFTTHLLDEVFTYDESLVKMLQTLKEKKYRLFCCSNSIREKVSNILFRIGVLPLLDGYYSNEDVQSPKPHPSIYTFCFQQNDLVPQQCLIVEDSPIGITAAELSGGHVMKVAGPHSVTLKRLYREISIAERKNREKVYQKVWPTDLQIVIPMAGAGSRFVVKGYTTPKPLIPINGSPMIEWVVRNLPSKARVIFIVLQSHLDNEDWKLGKKLRKYVPGCEIVATSILTEGPASSVLLAKELLNENEPLLIANSDQYLEWDVDDFLRQSGNSDGSISVFRQPDPTDTKWSYVRIKDSKIVETREKEVISEWASTGIYYWKRASDFVDCAESMIKKDIRVNKEFYVCPAYNEAIQKGLKIVPIECKKMWGLGVPKDLEIFKHEFLKQD